jgi:hypothetical protein
MNASYDLRTQIAKALRSLRWLPTYAWQRGTRSPSRARPVHFMIAVADHFEPSIVPGRALNTFADRDEQERRLERWCREYPKAVDPWRDSDGVPLRHTYFYPAEQFDEGLIGRLSDHCREGWGEIEIHLHHGLDGSDTAEHTRRVLVDFRDALARQGNLCRWNGEGPERYAFVHGNWALGNSANGRFCGVDEELEILADTGCYADFTLPSAPDPSQIGKINALYECALPLGRRAPHRRGKDLKCGRSPRVFPLIIQGPLGVRLSEGRLRIESGELTSRWPPTMERFHFWGRAAIRVGGRPDWIFIKLHCHGMDPRDESAMFGESLRRFLRELTEWARASGEMRLHFVTAREMANIALAACDGRDGNPSEFRDYRLQRTGRVPEDRGSASEFPSPE